MITLSPAEPDWIYIRQALALSLYKKKSILITSGQSYIENTPQYIPLLNDIKNTINKYNLGEITTEKGNILFNPGEISQNRLEIDSQNYSSFTETVLFLLPSLFSKEFRTIINLSGVSHSPLSYPTSFIRESFLSILESMGFFASMALIKFGFYGSGNGEAESRVYPAERKNAISNIKIEPTQIATVKIFISKMNMELAKREKEYFIKNFSIDEKKISIIEIQNAAGFGNSVQIYVSAELSGRNEQFNFILHREMEIYNCAGDMIFDEEIIYNSINNLMKECDMLIKDHVIPKNIIREIMPYLIISGCKTDHTYNEKTRLMDMEMISHLLEKD